VIGEEHFPYHVPPGAANPTDMPEDEVVALFTECSNRGRWGDDDELGTLNYITPAKRVQAAGLVRTGRFVSLGRDIDTVQSAVNPQPAIHQMLFYNRHALTCVDSIALGIHGNATTHLDALGHIFWGERVYNGRSQADVVTPGGLMYANILAQKEGIFTRGVLLDVAATRGVPWLTPDQSVTPQDLEAAERTSGVRVEPGDAVVVHVGLEAREHVEGAEDPRMRAGLDAGAVRWLHQRRVAVFTGDCFERIPQPYRRVPLPLHQVGLVAMGLVLLDNPTLAELVRTCKSLGRAEFLLTAAPLRIPNGTGSPVNPIAGF
jgi:kynurenine formamidase